MMYNTILSSGSCFHQTLKIVLRIILLVFMAACQENDGNYRIVTSAGTDNINEEESAARPDSFAVGSRTIFIHDYSRPFDSVAGIKTGVRSLITEVWYPVDHAEVDQDRYRQASYGDYVFGNSAMHHLMMTGTTFFHLTPNSVRKNVTASQIEAAISELFDRKRLSYVDAPLANTGTKLPVIVMSHGDAGSRYSMESLCEHLAAHGYFVIAPEHTGNSPYSMTGSDPALLEETGDPEFRTAMSEVLGLLSEQGAYGSEANFGQSYAPAVESSSPVQTLIDLDKALLQRLNDLRATLDELAKMNTGGPFTDRLNLENIGLMGRSFGGATTLAALNLEDRFTAGVAVVPPALEDPRSGIPDDVLVPADKESVLLGAAGDFPLSKFVKPTLLLVGEEDDLIIGLSLSMAKGDAGRMPSVNNPHPALRRAYETSSVPVVWASLANSNHATLGISGEYWWPELKPDVQARFFDTEQVFTLIDPVLAHTIQKEKVLAFFDLTIRGEELAGERLADQGYSSAGLTLEMRNF